MLLVVKLLSDYGYAGTKTFDAHPYRTEADPWDFVERCMRAYKAFEIKVDEVNADARLCAMLEELHEAPGTEWNEVLSAYSGRAARQPVHRVVCDYIAGMTDGFFRRTYQQMIK